MKQLSITILGAGNMGTALASVFAWQGHSVRLWNYDGDVTPLIEIQKFHENKKYLPGISLPKNITAHFEMETALLEASVVIFAVTSSALPDVLKMAKPFLLPNMICINVCKGFVPKTGATFSTLFQKIVPKNSFAVLSGPSIASQMALGQPVVLTVASRSKSVRENVKAWFSSPSFRLISTSDVVGVEIMGAIKNVYSMLFGMSEGVGFLSNSLAALFVSSFQEMERLALFLGAKKETVFGFSGLGDFLTTTFSEEGRSRSYGVLVGKGNQKDMLRFEKEHTVEATLALSLLLKKIKKKKSNFFILNCISNIVSGKISPQKGIESIFLNIQ